VWKIVSLQYKEIEEILRKYKNIIENSKSSDINFVQENMKIENEYEKKKNLIFKYFSIGLSRTKLVKIAYRLIDLKDGEFIIYSDSLVTNIGKSIVESTFVFIILDKNYNEIDEFSSSSEYWISSYWAEIFELIPGLIVLPEESNIKIFTDSQSMREIFGDSMFLKW
jgi:hypothetical protein